MEKPPARPKGNRILKLLPKATSFSISYKPYSPGRDKGHANPRGFSGPMLSIVPPEARRKSSGRGGYETPEPTSPKVSCIGQIKHKKKKKNNNNNKTGGVRAAPTPARTSSSQRKRRFGIGRMFGGGARAGGPVEDGPEKRTSAPAAPPIGQLRRFASGREALANFDWRASRVADESAEEERPDYSLYADGEESDDEMMMSPRSAPIIAHSAPIPMGAVEPKKEVNLWKRRTLSPPTPLHLQ